MYSSLRKALLTGGLTFSVIVGTLSVYALGAGTDLVSLMDKILLDTSISTDGTVKNSDKVDGLHASDILNAAGGSNITFSTCSNTDKKQMFYECDPTLAACLTPWAYCGGWVVAGTTGGSLIVAAISDDSNRTSYWYNNANFGIYYSAPLICTEKEAFGFDGWQLPTSNELSLICTNKNSVWNIDTPSKYWSSTDTNYINQIILIEMQYCATYNSNKNESGQFSNSDWYRVRCIRKY